MVMLITSAIVESLIDILMNAGSGSGQQSVTGFPNADDGNSFWIVEAASGKVCSRG